MSKRAIILSGGKGTRLKPYTIVVPKPLVPIGDYSILEIIIKQLARNNFSHITIAVGPHADLIRAFLGTGSKWNIKIDYSIENKPLSTMGPLRLINDLPEDFLIMNGDILTDLNYETFFDYHVNNNNFFTISSFIRKQTSEYGILEVNRDNILTGFKEKPTVEYEVSMGIYMANRGILRHIPRNKLYGFDDLMIKLIKLNMKISIKRHSGYWLDIGRPDDYAQAIDEFQMRKRTFLK